MRTIAAVNSNTPMPPTFVTDHNSEYPAWNGFLRTIEGNGLIRIGPPASGPLFQLYENEPPLNDFFSAFNFPDPYPEDLVGRNVTTAGSTFTITAEAFTAAQEAGSGGAPPITVEWFEALT